MDAPAPGLLPPSSKMLNMILQPFWAPRDRDVFLKIFPRSQNPSQTAGRFSSDPLTLRGFSCHGHPELSIFRQPWNPFPIFYLIEIGRAHV